MSSAMAFRDEMAGHATLAIMALLGTLLYSTTYALIYSSSSSNNSTSSIVAVLEMWMTGVHLLSACACCALQGLLVALVGLDRPVPYLARAQTAAFLGIAAAVTELSWDCLGNTAACVPYFGAAVLPQLAATGALVWSLLMYASSLGAQPWTGDLPLSLGFGGEEALLAAAVMGFVPWAVLQTLVATCGDAWRVQLCSAVVVTTNANVTASSIAADCGHLDTNLYLSAGTGFASVALACAARAFHNKNSDAQQKFKGLLGLLAALLATACPLLLLALTPSDVRLATPSSAYALTNALLASTSLVAPLRAVVAQQRPAPTPQAAQAAQPQAQQQQQATAARFWPPPAPAPRSASSSLKLQ